MATTPADSRPSQKKPDALIEHQDLLQDIEDHAAAVVSHEKDRSKHSQLLLGFSVVFLKLL